MSKFLTGALRGLNGVWKFPGQVASPPGYELGLPIQPIDDVGRIAAQQRALYIQITRNITIAAGATAGASAITVPVAFWGGQAGVADIPGVVAQEGFTQQNADVWLVGFWGSVLAATKANLDTLTVGLQRTREWFPPTPPSSNAEFLQLLAIYKGSSPLALTATSTEVAAIPGTAGYEMAAAKLPIRLPPSTNMVVRGLTTAGGGTTMSGTFVTCVAPKGVVPGGH